MENPETMDAIKMELAKIMDAMKMDTRELANKMLAITKDTMKEVIQDCMELQRLKAAYLSSDFPTVAEGLGLWEIIPNSQGQPVAPFLNKDAENQFRRFQRWLRTEYLWPGLRQIPALTEAVDLITRAIGEDQPDPGDLIQ